MEPPHVHLQANQIPGDRMARAVWRCVPVRGSSRVCAYFPETDPTLLASTASQLPRLRPVPGRPPATACEREDLNSVLALVDAFGRTPTTHHRANDLLRASQLPLLPVDDP